MLRLRPAGHGDLQLLRTLLFEAVFWRGDEPRPPLEQALAEPELARYVEGFGRPGDFGAVASAGEEDAPPLGAAWWRYFPPQAPGYGFVDQATPEVSLAVFPPHRGRGAGTALLAALEREARAREIAALSLSVQRDNPALRLYRRFGFRPCGRVDDALTMVLELSRAARGASAAGHAPVRAGPGSPER